MLYCVILFYFNRDNNSIPDSIRVFPVKSEDEVYEKYVNKLKQQDFLDLDEKYLRVQVWLVSENDSELVIEKEFLNGKDLSNCDDIDDGCTILSFMEYVKILEQRHQHQWRNCQ